LRSVIIIPGIGGSGEAHWQTLWEREDPSLVRIAPASWDAPDLEDWLAALDAAVAAAPEPPVLVAHSLGCLLVGHWWMRTSHAARGAFLVATPDPDGPRFPAVEAASFRGRLDVKAPFPVLMVASADDPYGTPAYAAARASAWGAELVQAGALGHINGSSGLGDWPWGRALLAGFIADRLPSPQNAE
jgi:predicted alpha/beta hydrolase family esterase